MLSPVEKVYPLLSSYIKIHPHICLELYWTVFACKWCLICTYFPSDSDMMTFSKDYRNTKTVHSYTYEWEKVQYGGYIASALELHMRIGWSRLKNKLFNAIWA